MPIKVITADITRLRMDAIVNAANPSLLDGGVDGAIHRAAGPALLQACRALPESAPGVRCPTGEARITAGFALPARHVIHTAGPIWHGGGHNEALLLERCYRNAMRRLREYAGRTIAFPVISCGVYGYPSALAAKVAVRAYAMNLSMIPPSISPFAASAMPCTRCSSTHSTPCKPYSMQLERIQRRQP